VQGGCSGPFLAMKFGRSVGQQVKLIIIISEVYPGFLLISNEYVGSMFTVEK
jgi:hypothetical protein